MVKIIKFLVNTESFTPKMSERMKTQSQVG